VLLSDDITRHYGDHPKTGKHRYHQGRGYFLDPRRLTTVTVDPKPEDPEGGAKDSDSDQQGNK
jgi:hypothetical protein